MPKQPKPYTPRGLSEAKIEKKEPVPKEEEKKKQQSKDLVR